jgi:hypothetical protein
VSPSPRPPVHAAEAPDEQKTALEEVKLPVCRECGRVGLQPANAGTGYFCTGPAGASHRRLKMVPHPFIPKPEEPEDD